MQSLSFLQSILPSISINNSPTNTELTLQNILIILATAVGVSTVIAVVYALTHKKTGYTPSLITSIIMVGPIASIVILIVGNSLATAVSVGGGIAFIRYRATLDSPSDVAYLFMSLALGMACGVGHWGVALVACAVFSLVLIILRCINLSAVAGTGMTLKVLIPENLNFYGLYDDIIKKYCKSYRLKGVKSVDYGTLFELNYKIKMKDPKEQKAFIDEIRTRNGNLTVSLTQQATEDQ